jgi:signal peptidase I
MKNMINTEHRRARLSLWFSDKKIPPEEKSYISQLIGGKASFGEKAARRIEMTYSMPNGYLDASDTDSAYVTYEIPQYLEVGGAMGDGLVLRDQPGQITGWKVTPEWANKNIPNNTGKENICIVTGFGDSMRGMFNSGDPLIVDTGVKEIKYDGVYFFRVGDEGFIKRLQRIPGDGIRVISKNQDYETWTIRDDMDFEVFGRVLKVWKSEEF